VLIDKRPENNLDTHIAFVVYEKTIDQVNKRKLWEMTIKKGTPRHIIQGRKSLYKRTIIFIDMGNKIGNKTMTTN
jgi:hypothetical protein